MIRVSRAVVSFLTLSSALFGQFRGTSDWSTNGSDAQRSSWIRTDPKISPGSVSAPGFQLQWKVKLGNEALSAPVLLDRYIGYRGFRTYAFVGGGAENAFALDSDLGRVEWRKRFTGDASGNSGSCPGGMIAQLTRPVAAEFPSANAGRFGGGRGGPAKSGVGEPLEGAVTIAQVAANRPTAAPPAPVTPPTANRPPAGGFGRQPSFLFGLSSDGAFHSMYVSNGEEAEAPIKFLPANAAVSDFSVVDGVAYATTTNNCGGVVDGVWALDLTAKTVTKWQGSLAGGEMAFGPAGAYLTSGSKLLKLDQKTLTASAAYDAGQPFSTAPLLFEYKGKAMIAAATKDGAIQLVDSAAPSVAAAKSSPGDKEPYALASWQTVAETRWIIATCANSITAWKLVDSNGSLGLQQVWTVHNVVTPAAPLIVNGVLFAVERGDGGHNAVLFAFDALTGKQLWSSGDMISSFVSKQGGLAAGGGSIYLGTHDGTLSAFGFPIEH